MNDDARAPSSEWPLDLQLTSPAGRRVIIGLAVGQALLLLFYHEAVLRAWPPFGSMAVRSVYLTVVIAVPTALYLLLGDPRQPRPWLLAGALGVTLVPGALYVGSQALPEAYVRNAPLFWPYGLSMGVVWFVAVAFFQAARTGWRRFEHGVLFRAGWFHLLALAFAALAIGLFWAVLALWDALFGVLGIRFFGDLFFDRRFVYAATGLVGGVGLVLARSYVGTAAALLRLVMTLLKALLPLVAALALIFLAALPFTGLNALWDTGRATVLMTLLVGLSVLFANGAFQRSTDAPPYPKPLRWIVETGLVALPAYTALSAYALFLRVGQYGWTDDRLWAALVVGLLGAFGLAYAAAVLYRHEDRWMGLMDPANTVLALAVVVVLLLTQTPLLSPHRVAVSDQVERLESGAVQAAADDTSHGRTPAEDVLRYLRFESGERGYRALQELKRMDAFAGRPLLAARLEAVLRDTSRFERPPPTAPYDTARLRAELLRVPDTLTIPPAFLGDVGSEPGPGRCLMPNVTCALFSADLHGDPRREFIILRKRNSGPRVHSDVFTRGDTANASRWRKSGELSAFRVSRFSAFLDSLRAGRYRLVPPQQRDLEVGRRRLRMDLH